jgi:hypothetical protein
VELCASVYDKYYNVLEWPTIQELVYTLLTQGVLRGVRGIERLVTGSTIFPVASLQLVSMLAFCIMPSLSRALDETLNLAGLYIDRRQCVRMVQHQRILVSEPCSLAVDFSLE